MINILALTTSARFLDMADQSIATRMNHKSEASGADPVWMCGHYMPSKALPFRSFLASLGAFGNDG